MRLAAIAVLLSLVAAFVCTADASLTATNGCCQPCSMEDGAPSCDCCRLSTPEFPSIVAAKATNFEPLAVTTVLPSLVGLLPTVVVSTPLIDQCEFVRDHSPPKLYVRHSTLLI